MQTGLLHNSVLNFTGIELTALLVRHRGIVNRAINSDDNHNFLMQNLVDEADRSPMLTF
jgi:hypothetical protein